MEKNVVVLTPNGRRQNVKVTPNTTLLQILEEACRKHGFESDDYCLKHHNKEVGLTQIFRFSGLPNNCLLEMYPTERKRQISNDIGICIQLENGSRFQGQFRSTDNLWLVVEQLCGEQAEMYKNPVAIYMRQEIIGREKMLVTSLKSLGITEGRAMIRFSNKTAEELKTQASVYIAPVAKEKAKDGDEGSGSSRMTLNSKSSSGGGGGGGFAITKEIVQSMKNSSNTDNESSKEFTNSAEKLETASTSSVESKPKYDWGEGVGRKMISSQDQKETDEDNEKDNDDDIEPEVKIVGERHAVLYSLDTAQNHLEDLPDSFYELTVHDLKLVLRDLQKIATGNEDAPLLTEKLRELEDNKTMLNKMVQYKHCVLRIKFPDRYVLQGIFKPFEKMADVVNFVAKFLIKQDLNFYLFTIPPKTILPLDKTLLELNLVPNAILNFAVEDDEHCINDSEQSYLKADLLLNLSTAEGAIYAATKFRSQSPKPTSGESNTTNSIKEYMSRPSNPTTGAIPKRPRNNSTK